MTSAVISWSGRDVIFSKRAFSRWLLTHQATIKPGCLHILFARLRATGKMSKRFGTLDWTLAGHSEGTVSATQAGRMASPYVKRIVLASSLTKSIYQGSG